MTIPPPALHLYAYSSHLYPTLHKAGSLGIGTELVDELLHMGLLSGRRLVRPPLILRKLRSNIHERVVITLIVLQLLGQEVYYIC